MYRTLPENCYIDLLRMLSHHEYERKIVHPESSVEQPICVDKEYDVLDGVFNEVRLRLCVGCNALDILAKHNWNRTLEPKQQRKTCLVIWWPLDDMCS